jgi:anti-anti-sigma factor
MARQAPCPRDNGTFRIDMHRGHMALSGDMDACTAPVFLDAVDHLVRRGARSIDVNLSGLTFLDAAGVRTLLEAQRRADDSGVPLWVHQPSRPARRVMELIGGLDELTFGSFARASGIVHLYVS